MAKYYRPGDVKYIAYPDEVVRVEIVERGTGGRVFKAGRKPKDAYVVSDGDDEYAISAEHLFDDPLAAAIRSAELAKELGIVDEDEDEEELEEEDDDDLDEDEELEEEEELEED